MSRISEEWRTYTFGVSIFVAVVVGGGPGNGLWTDTILQCLLLLSAAPVLAAPTGEPIERKLIWLCCGIIGAMVMQFIPMPEQFIAAFRPDTFLFARNEMGKGNIVTMGIGRTIEASIFVAVLIAFFLALLRLRGDQLHALLPFFLAGVICHVTIAAVQYSSTQSVRLEGFMPFPVGAGLFANRNHFAALMYVSLPFLVYVGTFRGMKIWASLSAVVLLLVLLAAGSRAGAALGLAALLTSALFLAARSRMGIGSVLCIVTAAGLYAFATWSLFERRDFVDPEHGRGEFLRNTLSGISENWILGVGYGNFERAYQSYERAEMIFSSYVNHAHNDYLEIIFEGGVTALLLLCIGIVMIFRSVVAVRHSHFHKAAFLGILFLLLHSTVDYPLRTMAGAVLFVYFNAILFHSNLRPAGKSRIPLIGVRHNGRKMVVPMEADRR